MFDFINNKVFKNDANKIKKILDTDDFFFTSKIEVDDFSQKIMKDISFFRNTLNNLQSSSLKSKKLEKLEKLEKEAFNLLVRNIELEKGTSKVEVGVIGGFTSGKSTFINSLLKKDVCSMDVNPTTSSITKFYYGHTEKITLNGKEITQEEYQNLSKHLKGSIKHTKAHKIEYAYPFNSFNSIILYDTPGFDNDELNGGDTQITLETLKSVDVVFFVVDISKGTIDLESIKTLENLKDKILYCILNKSDLKSEEAIVKIKKEIESKDIFKEIIEYSSSKVLEEGKKEIFKDFFEELEEEYIENQKSFESKIKGKIVEKKGRRKTKKEYHLTIDNNEIIIDNFYLKAKRQRNKIENLLNNLSDIKRVIVKQNFDKSKIKYEKESKIVIKNILNKVKTIKVEENSFENFSEAIEKFKIELEKYEDYLIISYYNEIIRIYTQCLVPVNVSSDEKSFWSTPYAKIEFKKNKFNDLFEKLDFFRLMDNFLLKYYNFFKENYHFDFNIRWREIESYKSKLYDLFYTNTHNGSVSSYYSDSEIFYFEDLNEAKEWIRDLKTDILNSFKNNHKDRIYNIIYGLNYEEIEKLKRELHTADNQNSEKITDIKKELENFLKENNA